MKPQTPTNYALMAYNLLDAAVSLAGIIDQPLKGNLISVNFAYAAELIRNVQSTAKSAVDELMYLHEKEGGLL